MEITRRDTLKLAGAVALGSMLPNVVEAAAVPAPLKPIRLPGPTQEDVQWVAERAVLLLDENVSNHILVNPHIPGRPDLDDYVESDTKAMLRDFDETGRPDGHLILFRDDRQCYQLQHQYICFYPVDNFHDRRHFESCYLLPAVMCFHRFLSQQENAKHLVCRPLLTPAKGTGVLAATHLHNKLHLRVTSFYESAEHAANNKFQIAIDGLFGKKL